MMGTGGGGRVRDIGRQGRSTWDLGDQRPVILSTLLTAFLESRQASTRIHLAFVLMTRCLDRGASEANGISRGLVLQKQSKVTSR